MKRQLRPFVVEVKQKRGTQKRGHSIWGNVDLSAAMREIRAIADPANQHEMPPVDSGARPANGGDRDETQTEQVMPGPDETEVSQAAVESPATQQVREPAHKAPRTRKPKAEAKQHASKRATRKAAEPATDVATVSARATRKSHSAKERAQKLAQIEKAIAGRSSIKSAVAKAGISEQTYYLWKKAAAPAQNSGDLKDLVALEDENKRLKGLLAERLRKENAELKKRLGLD